MVLKIFGGVLVSFFLLILWLRRQATLSKTGESRSDLKLKAAIKRYAESRGGTVGFEGLQMHVKGARGEGTLSMVGLRVMCEGRPEANWELSISFRLREFIPDQFDELMDKAAAAKLLRISPAIAGLKDADIHNLLRATVVSVRAPSNGLMTCVRPLTKRYELRAMLEGFELEGLTDDARSRFSESDHDLLERAIAQTINILKPPKIEDGGTNAAHAHLWLSCPLIVFGKKPFIVFADGANLRWVAATERIAEEGLAALANTSMQNGPMKGVMWGWDGQQLHEAFIIQHSIMGPTSPHYTLSLPLSMHRALGIEGSADGRFGVRRSE
jgi:hypothetical protein